MYVNTKEFKLFYHNLINIMLSDLSLGSKAQRIAPNISTLMSGDNPFPLTIYKTLHIRSLSSFVIK